MSQLIQMLTKTKNKYSNKGDPTVPCNFATQHIDSAGVAGGRQVVATVALTTATCHGAI